MAVIVVANPEGERPAWDGPVPGVKHFARLDELAAQVGRELAESDWMLVDQPRIDRFAEATGDWQWIHVDAARAQAGPFGTTIAHGFLTVSLLPAMRHAAFHIDDVRMGINYGLNRVRFPAPVPVGSRVKARFRLLAYEPLPGGAQLTIQATIEREGGSKPVCVAELVSRHYL